jgi:hypothetical protein
MIGAAGGSPRASRPQRGNRASAASRSRCQVNDRWIARPVLGSTATVMRISHTPGRRSRSEPDRQSRTIEVLEQT